MSKEDKYFICKEPLTQPIYKVFNRIWGDTYQTCYKQVHIDIKNNVVTANSYHRWQKLYDGYRF